MLFFFTPVVQNKFQIDVPTFVHGQMVMYRRDSNEWEWFLNKGFGNVVSDMNGKQENERREERKGRHIWSPSVVLTRMLSKDALLVTSYRRSRAEEEETETFLKIQRIMFPEIAQHMLTIRSQMNKKQKKPPTFVVLWKSQMVMIH